MCDRRATMPLDSGAVAAADDEIYAAHENDKRPNALFDENGNRLPLDADDPSQAGLRSEWMDNYVANGGQVEQDCTGAVPDDPVGRCPYEDAPADPTLGHIFVTVHQPNGVAIPQAEVMINDAFVGLTDENGLFDYGDVTPDTYEASTSKPGYYAARDHESAYVAAGTSRVYALTLELLAPSCQIMHTTVATSPYNRQRRRIGVGEKVALAIPQDNGQWNVEGPGVLDTRAGNMVELTAGDSAGRVFISVQGQDGCFSRIDFEVVEPDGVELVAEPAIGHTQGTPSVELYANVHITPADVSFQGVYFRELKCLAKYDGYFERLNDWEWTVREEIVTHEPNALSVIGGEVVEGYGTYADYDGIIMNDNGLGQPFSDGSFTWPIPWEYRVEGGQWKRFATVNQIKLITPTGKLTVLKSGVFESKELMDPTTSR